MSGWAARRFWTDVRVQQEDDGFAVLLDDRPVRTPAKALLRLPSAALAQAVAAEWQAQPAILQPAAMPLTRTANSAIDTVMPQREAVAGRIAAYAETDLLCYRATAPAELVARQAAAWDPLLDWSAGRHGARLVTVAGVMFQPQSPEALAAFRLQLAEIDAFRLAALHALVALSGSLVLGLAVLERHQPPEDLWRLSRIDEDWQVALWGEDAEAAAHAMQKRAAFLLAARFDRLSGGDEPPE